MNVLVACEESQTVCCAFRLMGHNAFSCDILPCSGGHPEWHIQDDVLPLLNGNCSFITSDNKLHTLEDRWDLIIAHPPCTYLSKAGARWMFPQAGIISNERFERAMDAKKFFMEIYNANCDKIVIENPVPLKCVGLPIPTQKIQPYQFDEFGEHPYSKATLLWIKGLPQLRCTTPMNVPVGTWVPSNTSRFSRGFGGSKGVAHNSVIRSRTFFGVAYAMAEQWGDMDRLLFNL